MKYRYLGPLLIYSCFTTTTEAVEDAVTEQSPFRPVAELHGTADPSLSLLPSLMGCPTCAQQPSIYCDFCKNPNPRDDLCCKCSRYCCCTLLCPLLFLRHAPDEAPYEGYVGFGDPSTRLCCGPDCSMDRCLKLIQLQFQILQEPLAIERNATRGEDYKEGNGDEQDGNGDDQEENGDDQEENGDDQEGNGDANCCGKGCPATGCFQHLLDSIILLQNPIQNTLNSFNKSEPETTLGEGHEGL